MLSHFIEIAEHFKTLLIESCDAIAIAQNIVNGMVYSSQYFLTNIQIYFLRGDRGARKNIVDIHTSLDLNLEPRGQVLFTIV